ncbi:hypothetical protein [Agromyces sp. Root81]|uniref:hypothetical protein n=1 Tax=Agromyces sp. Root81 TaxID=1736601 RepID=UPI0012FC367D|nr:hypothetical protein [Agromyces sp. Root81]
MSSSSFDHNQKRGHASNPGRWSEHRHTEPETALAAYAPTPPDTLAAENVAGGGPDERGFGTFDVDVEGVRTGDAVYAAGDGEDYKFVGRAAGVAPHPSKEGKLRVSFADGGGLVGDPSDKIAVVRDELPPRYDPTDRDYWRRVSSLYHPAQTADTLDRVANKGGENEDDVLLAVTQHPNASASALDAASKHSSFAVRSAVIAHPATSVETLTNMAAAAEREAADAAERVAEGVNLMQSYHQRDAEQAGKLAAAATERLETR